MILARRLGETVLIDDDIEVKFFSVESNQIRIGIQAPKDVKILREELRLEAEDEARPAIADALSNHWKLARLQQLSVKNDATY